SALLLPDATVLSMGSNPGQRGKYEPAIEIYTPAYLFDANDRPITTNRPQITGVPSQPLGYGETFFASYSSTSAIRSAVLARLGSSPHAYDMEQRLIGLCGPSPQPPCSGSPGTLQLVTPPNGNIAPPGFYMLFLVDSTGVPSKAQFVQLTPYSTSPPDGTISAPASDVTIPAGGTVAFGTTTSAAKDSWIFPGGTPQTSVAPNPGDGTFSAPGLYDVSLTGIDGSGNSDSHPPTRRVFVTPSTPDFEISVSPPAQVVAPGDSTTFTITVTPKTSFTDVINLTVGSETPYPGGVSSGGITPASITGSGTAVLTMNTNPSTVPFATSLTITGTSGTLVHTASTTLLVNLAPPASLTATAGNGQVALSWPASGRASGYHLKRANVSGGPYVTVACPTTTSYVDTRVTNGTPYYYVVSAWFSGNPTAGAERADSGEASSPPKPPPPPAPTGLTATAGNGQVALAWSASAGSTNYQVKRATVSGGPYSVITSTTSTTYTNT